MIVLNVLHSAKRKLSMKLQPQLPVPPFPHAFLPFLLLPSFPSPLLYFFPPFPALPFPCTPPPSIFPMDCLPIDSYCICTSLFIIPPPILSYLFLPYIWRRSVRPCLVVVLEHPT